MRQTLVAGVIAVALIGAFMLGSQLPNVGFAQTSSSTDTERTITVTGIGAVAAAPDALAATIGVTSFQTSLTEALAENNEQMNAIIQLLKDAGIADRDIQTSNFNVNVERENFNGPITGYRVSNAVSVLIRDIDAAGSILDQAVQAGANEIYGIQLSVTDRADLESQARVAAVENAMSTAQELVSAAGNQLGQVLRIDSLSSSSPVAEAREFDIAASSAAVPLEGGELLIQASVQVTFAIE